MTIRFSAAKNPNLRMERNHIKIVEWHGGEFYNHGASSGDSWIVSKTSIGRVMSRVEDGKVRHYWADGDSPVRMRGIPKKAE